MLAIQSQFFSVFKKVAAIFVIFILVGGFFVFSLSVSAQDITAETEALNANIGLSDQSLTLTIAKGIRIFLGFTGVILLFIVLYAGFLYMTSGGEPAKIEKAKKFILSGVIGLIIILTAFAITSFIISTLETALGTGGGSDGTGTTTEYTPSGLATGALGKVIIDHYPGVEMTVPRNTVIMVTFREAISPASILNEGYSCNLISDPNQSCTPTIDLINQGNLDCVCRGIIKTSAIQIYRACDSVYPDGSTIPEEYQYSDANRTSPEICNQWKGNEPAAENLVTDGNLSLTPDMRTFVFKPANLLGYELNNIIYFVNLTNNIQKLSANQGIFSALPQKGYRWNFTVNTTVDVSSPYIVSVSPVVLNDDGQAVTPSEENAFSKNKSIIINFNEPILPLSYLLNNGSTNQEIAITVDGEYVEGRFESSSNQYRSVVFKPTGSCGSDLPIFNSCGNQVYCLPGNSLIDAKVFSVTTDKLVEGLGPQVTVYPAGGILDTAFNALDTDGKLGKGNGKTEGAKDNYGWQFQTTDDLDLIPPKILEITPKSGDDKDLGVKSDSLITALFDKIIDPSTVSNENLSIDADNWNGWYTGGMYCPSEEYGNCQKQIIINHGDFPLAKDENDIPLIYPRITSGVKDDSGNCFNPCSGPGCDNLATGESCDLIPIKQDVE